MAQRHAARDSEYPFRARTTTVPSDDRSRLITPKETAAQNYWALVLGADRACLYAGWHTMLTLHADYRWHSALTLRDLDGAADPDVRQAALDAEHYAFLRQVERDITGVLDADCRPLVVAGACRSLASFYALTRWRALIVGTVTGNYVADAPADIAALVWPVLFASFVCRGQ